MIESVSYYDKSRPPPVTMGAIDLLLRKRKSFEHEHEVRAIIPAFRDLEASLEPAGKPINAPIRKDELINEAAMRLVTMLPGKAIAIDKEKLIENVRVAPGSPEWLVYIVQSLLERFGLDREAIVSELDDPI